MRTSNRFIIATVLALAALGAAAQARADYDVRIVSPVDGATVFSDPGDVPVRLSVVPALAAGDRVQVLVDGTPVAPPMGILEFPLQGVPRGEHVLESRIIDSSGNVSATSSSTIFYVWQASLLFPSRQKTDGTAEPTGSSAIPAQTSGAISSVGTALSASGIAARGGSAIHAGR